MAAAALVMFSVMFLVVFVLRTVIQKRRTGDSGLRTGFTTAPPGSLEWIAGWLLVLAMLAAVAAPVAEIAGLEPLTTNSWIRGVGIGVAAFGIALTFLAQLNMGAEWRIGLDVDEVTGLVTAGAFAVVRNPIFSAMFVTGAGLALMVPNPISIAGFLLLVAAVELQVRVVEEPHLRRLHGAIYGDYERRVGRFVPGIGRD